MLIEYDTEAEVTYFTLDDRTVVSRCVQVSEEISVDLDGAGTVVGVDFLLPARQFLREHADQLDLQFPGLGTAVYRALSGLIEERELEIG